MLPRLKLKPHFSKLSQAGQGIIEIIVVVGIASIVILTLVVLSTKANQSSKVSSTQDQAARFAQQGLEIIRNARIPPPTSCTIPNCAFNYDSGCSNGGSSYDSWSKMFTKDVSDNCSAYGRPGHIHTPAEPPVGGVCANWCVNFDSGGISIFGKTNFTRTIYVADTAVADGGVSQCNAPGGTDYQTVKQFTVVVSWNDTSGSHKSVATSCITESDSFIN